MWPAQHPQQYQHPGVMLVAPQQQQQLEPQYIQPIQPTSQQQVQLQGLQVPQQPLYQQQPQLQAQALATQQQLNPMQQALLLQQQQMLQPVEQYQQLSAQQVVQQPQQMALQGYAAVAPPTVSASQWPQQQQQQGAAVMMQNTGAQLEPAVQIAPSAAAASYMLPQDATYAYQPQQQQMLMQPQMQQVASMPGAAVAVGAQMAVQQQQQPVYQHAAVVPQQQYQQPLQQQYQQPLQQLYQQQLPMMAAAAAAGAAQSANSMLAHTTAAAASYATPWHQQQQQQQPVPQMAVVQHQEQQQYQSPPPMKRMPAAAAANKRPMLPAAAQRNQQGQGQRWQQQQGQQRSQQGRQQSKQTQQQQQGRQQGKPKQQQQQQQGQPDFDFEQWQQQSGRWRSQARQQQEAEQQQQGPEQRRLQQRLQQLQQKPDGALTAAERAEIKKLHIWKKQLDARQRIEQWKEYKLQLEQHKQEQQQQGKPHNKQQQQPPPQLLTKLSRKAKNKLNRRLRAQQQQQQGGQGNGGQQQQQNGDQQQPSADQQQQPSADQQQQQAAAAEAEPEDDELKFPILRVPPKVLRRILNRMPFESQLNLATALPQGSLAAAVVCNKFKNINLKQRLNKHPRPCDLPDIVTRMSCLESLKARCWMDGNIQARTVLASLSSLTALTSLELIIDVDPESNIQLPPKPTKKQENAAKRRKFGPEAPPQPTLTQQLDEQLLNPAVKLQEDFWQITSALGKLTGLKELNIASCNNSNTKSKQLFKQLGYQSLAPLSSLTGLESFHIKYSVCQAGAGLACLSGLTGMTNLSLVEEGGTMDITDGEPGVAALGPLWQNALQLQLLKLRTQYLGPEVVRQFALKTDCLRVLDVSDCRGLFPGFRTWGHLRRLTCLQELHVSNCQGITAADLEAVASTVANSLTLLDISRNAFQPDGGDLRGSIDALGRLTNLQDLKAFGSCIAPVGDGSEGGVCNILAQLTQLTFLTVGNVLRSVMVMPADDVAHLSKLSKLEKLHLAGAQLGVGLDQASDDAVIEARLEFLKPLRHLKFLRLWACRFSKVSSTRVKRAITGIRQGSLAKKNVFVVDGQWYPDRANAVHDEPAEYSGDEADIALAAVGDGGE